MRSSSVGFVFFFLSFSSLLNAGEIVVACYNVKNYLLMERTQDGKKQPNQPKPESEIQAVLKIVERIHPDILGLMEMGGEQQLDDFQFRLGKIGLEYPYREWVRGMGESRHVCLLSRFPIVDRNSRNEIPFKLKKKIEWMNRGILDVTVQVNPAYRLRLVGVHLKSRREAFEYDEKWKRAKEAWHLKDHIREILSAEKNANVLLFGDLNDTKNEYPIREIIGAPGDHDYMKDLALKDARGETWTHCWNVADSYSRIDYFMASPGLVKEILPDKCGINDAAFWNEASDHRAIYATLSATEK